MDTLHLPTTKTYPKPGNTNLMALAGASNGTAVYESTDNSTPASKATRSHA